MRTRVSVFCSAVIEAGWLAAVIIVPLFFDIYSQRVFEPDKLSLLRSIALVMAVVWLIRFVEDRRARPSEDSRSENGEGSAQPVHVSFWQRLAKTPLVLPTLLLVLVYVLSTPFSLVPRVSLWGSYQRLQGTYTTLSYIVIFFLALEGIRTKTQFGRLITVMILVSFPIAMYGLIQHFGLDPLPWGGNVTTRVASNMGNAIFVAAFLILVVPLTLSRLIENWNQAVGHFETRDGLLGVAAFVLLVGALLVGMLAHVSKDTVWVRWAALLIGIGLQAPIYFFTPSNRRARVLTISLPLTFAFLVGFSWILEIFFPPESASYFWLGLLAAFIFVLAMAAFAYYLRKPVARLLLLAAYFVMLIAQMVCIFYTQSRGPLLGLLGGLFFYFALLGLIKKRIWLPWLMSAAAVLVAVVLVLFNTVDTPLIDTLRDTPYVGRLGKVLQTETGTGKVRVLIWEGAVQMIGVHPALDYPGQDGGPDALALFRPIIGYGPESMYVGYNRFYPTDLAHFEKRNASPDRSHNETLDALVTTGGVGFAVYMILFTSVFYFGLKWLGMIRKRWQTLTFLGLFVGGGIAGAVAAWAWRGPLYVGVGIPGGAIVGLAAFIFLVVMRATFKPETRELLGGRYSLWMLALVAAVIAHFIEIHFGIAIAATRTYFWTMAALMAVIGTRLALQPAEAEPATSGLDAEKEEPRSHGRRRRRRGPDTPPRVHRRTVGAGDWQGSIMILSVLAILFLGTMLFDFITIQQGDPGLLPTIVQSLTITKGKASPVMMALFAATWLMIGLVGLGDLATSKEGEGKKPAEWLGAAGIFALVSFGGALLFALFHATRLKPITITTVDAPNPLTDTITFYYIFVFLVLIVIGAIFTFLFRRSIISVRWSGQLAEMGVASLAVVLPVVAGVLIFATNVSIVRADILYKQGLSSENAKQWDGAIYFYDKAIEMAKDQDFYYLFLGRAYMEKGKATTGQEQEKWLEESEKALLKARDLAPLNTDHSANLARLYRTWGGLSTGTKRNDLLEKALLYYADATSLSPNNAQLFNEWGQTYYIMGDTDRALEMYQKSMALDSEYDQTYLLLGEYYMQQQQWDQAAEEYRQLIEIKPASVDAYSAMGYVYTQMDDLEAALAAYQKAVELRPRDFNNHKNLAILYQQLGRIDEAVVEATQALDLAPESQKQTMQGFLTQLQQLQTGSSSNAQLIEQLIADGKKQMDAEDWESAENTFKQVLALAPNDPQAHSALAFIYAKQNRIDEAISENLSVVDLVPQDYSSHKNLALLYEQQGQLDKAVSAADQALALAPDNEKEALQAFVDQLKQMQAASSPAEGSIARAGDLQPSERNDMYSTAPPMTIDPGKSYQATIVTQKGNIVVELDAADAPLTVNNFVYLARQGFYNGLTFHRVENQPGFSLIQGGDPTGTGRGGPGYTVPAEIGLPHNVGAIATARTSDQVNPERSSSGSQFYICVEPIHQLDGAYTVFGYVTEGLDVAQQIEVGDQILTVVISER
jgi:cyclophilin family peptidyl-prolyl cis-trans isomerase/Flp pilus assembly protein TadD